MGCLPFFFVRYRYDWVTIDDEIETPVKRLTRIDILIKGKKEYDILIEVIRNLVDRLIVDKVKLLRCNQVVFEKEYKDLIEVGYVTEQGEIVYDCQGIMRISKEIAREYFNDE